MTDGSVFGSPSFSFPLRVTANGVVYSISGRTGNTLYIDSVIEGTADQNLSSGTQVENLMTAGALTDIHQSLNTLKTQVDASYSIRSSMINQATDGITITFDLAIADTHMVTLGGNRTLALSNQATSPPWRRILLILKQDATGGRTVTWFNGIVWMTAGGTPPTLASGANQRTAITLIQESNGVYLGFLDGTQG